MQFIENGVQVGFYHGIEQGISYNQWGDLVIRIKCRALEWQILGLTQIFNCLSPFFSSIKELDINWGLAFIQSSAAMVQFSPVHEMALRLMS
jgi:hypothetical protein